jgi:hypothetical protein
MEMRIAFAAAALAFSVWAQADSPIEPHVDAGGVVSWTATIDAETVKGFIDTASGAVEENSPRIAALGRWLDTQLAAVSWCKHGWMYQVSSPIRAVAPRVAMMDPGIAWLLDMLEPNLTPA